MMCENCHWLYFQTVHVWRADDEPGEDGQSPLGPVGLWAVTSPAESFVTEAKWKSLSHSKSL